MRSETYELIIMPTGEPDEYIALIKEDGLEIYRAPDYFNTIPMAAVALGKKLKEVINKKV